MQVDLDGEVTKRKEEIRSLKERTLVLKREIEQIEATKAMLGGEPPPETTPTPEDDVE